MAAIDAVGPQRLHSYEGISEERDIRTHEPDTSRRRICSEQYRRGRGRLTDKSFAVFLGQARGSLFELQTQIELEGDLGLADSGQVPLLLAEASEISSMIYALLAAIRQDT